MTGIDFVGRKLSKRQKQRLLEIVPGLLTWSVLLVPLIAALAIRIIDLTKLWILGVAAIVLDLYWFIRTLQMIFSVRKALNTIRDTEAIDWWKQCTELDLPSGAPRPDEVTHCILIPTYTEKYEVLKQTVDAIAKQNYPAHLKVVAIITRVTDTEGVEDQT